MSRPRSYSLLELTGSVRRCLEASFSSTYWVRAETSDLRHAGASGHCYMELLEKGSTGNVVARVRATIWASTYAEIHQSLIASGAGPLTSGMNILARVSISYHEQYGLSLQIHEIDPSYSLGELARLRLETIERLKRHGILEVNKSLELPRPLQRIAIVSAQGAAGYGDFVRHLRDNRYGLHFYTALFSAQMQGEQTTSSVIAALRRIFAVRSHFDAVVIIRGGGAVSELRAFDSYELCEYCAQFPLPLFSGIGHERDLSVLDMVAHTSFKTPTAVADYLVQNLYGELRLLEAGGQRLRLAVLELMAYRERRLEQMLALLPRLGARRLELEGLRQSQLHRRLSHSLSQRLALELRRVGSLAESLPHLGRRVMEQRASRLERLVLPLGVLVRGHEARWRARLDQLETAIRLSHPEHILSRGFAIVEHEGKIITEASTLNRGDRLRIRLSRQSIEASVETIQ